MEKIKSLWKRENRMKLTMFIFAVFILIGCSPLRKTVELKKAEDFFNKGENAYYYDNDMEMAIQNFTEAIRLDPDFYSAYAERGHIYYLKGEYDLAIKDFGKALDLYPWYYWLRQECGDAHFQMGDYTSAIADYEAILDIYPDRDNTEVEKQIRIARNHYRRQLMANAIPGTTEHTAETHYQRGLDYAYNKGQDNAHKEDLQTMVLSAFWIAYPGDLNMAIREWKEALEIYPDHTDAKQRLERVRTQRSFFASSDLRWEKWNAEMTRDETDVGYGYGVSEYFLYHVDASAGETNIMSEASFHLALVKSLEEIGFIVDYDSIRINNNNTDLSENVKYLMSKHGANVSVTLRELNSNDFFIENLRVTTNMCFEGERYAFTTFYIYPK